MSETQTQIGNGSPLKTHIFGELDLDLNLGIDAIWEYIKDISGDCGYSPKRDDDRLITVYDHTSYESAKIIFDGGKVVTVKRTLDGKNWETYNCEKDQFMVSPETLKRYAKKIEWHSLEDDFPFSQGYLINHLIKLYKMPAIRAGYHGELIAVETKRQIIMWRDTGIGAEFIGLINKEAEN